MVERITSIRWAGYAASRYRNWMAHTGRGGRFDEAISDKLSAVDFRLMNVGEHLPGGKAGTKDGLVGRG